MYDNAPLAISLWHMTRDSFIPPLAILGEPHVRLPSTACRVDDNWTHPPRMGVEHRSTWLIEPQSDLETGDIRT